MKTELKGNIYNIGLINNTAQANTDISTNINLQPAECNEIKTGIVELTKAFIDSKTFRFIGETKYNKEKYEYELKQRINNIPNEYITKPRKSIVGPVLENLRYNMDEEQIREMFTNILTGEVDERKQKNILPAYTEIIKQLSKEDAIFLNTLKQVRKHQLSTCIIRLEYDNKEGYINLDTIIADGLHHTLNPKKIVLENLERLNIINLSSNIMLPENKKIVKNAFIHYKDSYSGRDKPSNANVTYTEGLLTITDFGWNFIDICCS